MGGSKGTPAAAESPKTKTEVPLKTSSRADGGLIRGTIHASAADLYVLSQLMERALAKFSHSSRDSLLLRAKFELIEAGNWRDDVHIDVILKKTHRVSRCMRLLHGVPSPRYWYANFQQTMVAIDVIYFFANGYTMRQDILEDCIPELATFEALEEWLQSFSSRRFHRNLVNSLLVDTELNLDKWGSYMSRSLVFQQTALQAAEIDRYAWVRGYTAINLAKAAPVWTPPKKKVNHQ